MKKINPQKDEETIFVVYNGNKEAVKIALPEAAEWDICIDDDKASVEALRTVTDAEVEVQGVACLVYHPEKYLSNAARDFIEEAQTILNS